MQILPITPSQPLTEDLCCFRGHFKVASQHTLNPAQKKWLK